MDIRKEESLNGELDVVRNISIDLYRKILYYPNTFRIDSDAVDDIIQSIIPEKEWKEFVDQLDRNCLGAIPYFEWEGSRIESLRECNEMMIEVLKMADEGEEVDIWVEWDGKNKVLFSSGGLDEY